MVKRRRLKRARRTNTQPPHLERAFGGTVRLGPAFEMHPMEVIMNDAKNQPRPSKAELDKHLDDGLKQSFPASDPLPIGKPSTEPDRPINRKPALPDKELVRMIADNVASKHQDGKE
jgi:hypothetical protein